MGLFKRDPDGPPAYDGAGYAPDKKAAFDAGPSAAGPLYACLHLSREDRIRLLGFPPHITDVLRDTLALAWPVGLQNSEGGAGWHEFKLRGNPCENARPPGLAAR